MSNYSNKAGIFVRNSLEGKSNNTVDPMLSKIEDRINSLGQYIQQRHGRDSFNELLNHVCSDKDT